MDAPQVLETLNVMLADLRQNFRVHTLLWVAQSESYQRARDMKSQVSEDIVRLDTELHALRSTNQHLRTEAEAMDQLCVAKAAQIRALHDTIQKLRASCHTLECRLIDVGVREALDSGEDTVDEGQCDICKDAPTAGVVMRCCTKPICADCASRATERCFFCRRPL